MYYYYDLELEYGFGSFFIFLLTQTMLEYYIQILDI